MQLIIISGLAGAGKSTALKILEDSGYYCIDNLPPTLLSDLVKTYSQTNKSGMDKIAVSIDTRSQMMLRSFTSTLQKLTHSGIEIKIIYLESREEVLIKRFSETRRRHPLSSGKNTISDCILEEREILSSISSISHHIDTSDFLANELRSVIKQFVNADYSQLNIVIQSFGFKYGIPIDSDFVFDVRCLPNPHYDDEIRNFNGTQEPIIRFLSAQPKVQAMIADIHNMLNDWLKEFSLDNRNYLTISIGCTGGKHRSVYIAEQLAALIKRTGYQTMVRHRQLLA